MVNGMGRETPASGKVHRGISLLLLAWGILCHATAARATDTAASSYHRMAILSDAELQRTGIADLLANKLQEAGLQLVERDKLQAVLQEQSIDLTLGPVDGSRRIRIGQLVDAQALVLIHGEGTGNDRRISVVLAECSRGARLSMDSFSGSAPAEEIVHRIGNRIEAVRRRFSGGLKAVVGVPAFISHTFTYECHPLQAGYAALLREGLATFPGIAIVEIEEARSIRHELEVAGGHQEGVWPAFVEGNFEVKSPTTAPAVDFTIAIRTTAGVRMIDKHGLTLPQAAAFVAAELPREILPDGRGPAPKPFTPEQEFSALTARADSFANLGEFPHSVDLRQAALVLDPDSLDQHKKLASEAVSYLSLIHI